MQGSVKPQTWILKKHTPIPLHLPPQQKKSSAVNDRAENLTQLPYMVGCLDTKADKYMHLQKHHAGNTRHRMIYGINIDLDVLKDSFKEKQI